MSCVIAELSDSVKDKTPSEREKRKYFPGSSGLRLCPWVLFRLHRRLPRLKSITSSNTANSQAAISFRPVSAKGN